MLFSYSLIGTGALPFRVHFATFSNYNNYLSFYYTCVFFICALLLEMCNLMYSNGNCFNKLLLTLPLILKIRFECQWLADSQNVLKNPKFRSYSLYKHGLYFESCLNSISNVRHRTTLTKLRTSSHVLEIERGRYTFPKTAVYDRLCKTCYQIEDEGHFLINCKMYDPLRRQLYSKVSRITELTLL